MNWKILRFFLPVQLLAWIAIRIAAPGIIAGGDSGELVTAAYSLGVAHPPGYPLYVTITHLFTFLPVGTPAFRVTLLSCLALAFSYPFLASTLEKVLEPHLPSATRRRSLAGAITFFAITNPLVLAMAQGPEVYALHFFFSALLLLLVVRADASSFLLLSLAAGMMLSHHYLVAIAAPAVFLARGGRLLRPKMLLFGLSLLVLGMFPLLVLPLRAHFDPAANWGDPSHLERFIRHIVRTQYMGMGSGRITEAWDNMLHYGSSFLGQTWWVGLLAFVAVWRKDLWVWTLATIMQFVGLSVLLLVEQDPVSFAVNDAFIPPVFLWSAPLIAVGVAQLLRGVKNGVTGAALLVALSMMTTLHAVWAVRETDASSNLASEQMGRNVLLNLPQSAALYSRGDSPTFALFYLKKVRGLRPDVNVTDRTGGTFGDPYGLLNATPGDVNAYLTTLERAWEMRRPGQRNFYAESNGVPGRRLDPYGLIFEADPAAQATGEDGFWRRALRPEVSVRDEFFTRQETGFYHLFKGWWFLRRKEGGDAQVEFSRMREIAGNDSRLLMFLSSIYLRHGLRREAGGVSEEVLRFAPDNVEALFELGLLAEGEGLTKKAEERYRRCLELAPRRMDIRNNLAVLLMQDHRGPEAISELERIRKEAPEDTDALRNLAIVLWDVDRERAKDLFRRYLERVPDSSDRADILKHIR